MKRFMSAKRCLLVILCCISITAFATVVCVANPIYEVAWRSVIEDPEPGATYWGNPIFTGMFNGVLWCYEVERLTDYSWTVTPWQWIQYAPPPAPEGYSWVPDGAEYYNPKFPLDYMFDTFSAKMQTEGAPPAGDPAWQWQRNEQHSGLVYTGRATDYQLQYDGPPIEPEPSSLLAIGGGMITLGVMRRRRR